MYRLISLICRLSALIAVLCSEHQKDKTSVIAQHQNTENHNFDFKNIHIVDQESKWVKRKVSESINIHLHAPTINLKEDTNNVNVSYIHTINTLKRR